MPEEDSNLTARVSSWPLPDSLLIARGPSDEDGCWRKSVAVLQGYFQRYDVVS